MNKSSDSIDKSKIGKSEVQPIRWGYVVAAIIVVAVVVLSYLYHPRSLRNIVVEGEPTMVQEE